MSKTKKIATILLTCCLLLTSLSACMGTIEEGETQEVQIYLLDAGYGTKFMDRWIEEFEELEKDIKISYEADSGVTLKLGNDILDESSETDLWFAGEINYATLVDWGPNLIRGYDCVLEDLTDFVKGNAYGESVSIESKLKERSKYYNTLDNRYYTLSWASGPGGLIYNTDYITEEPKTSKQLIATADTLLERAKTDPKYTPFIWSGGNAGEYWMYVVDTWAAQYMGVDRFDEYVELKVNGKYTYEPLGDPGVRAVYEEVEKIAKEKYSLDGSSGGMHTLQQQEFLRGNGAMMPNGDWLENEMKKNDGNSNYAYNIKMMKVPVISALGVKLELGGAGASDSQHEQVLVNIITDIDAGKSDSEIASTQSVSADKVAKVRDARNIMYDIGVTHRVYIPSFSDAKEASKKFLSFVYSDRGEQIFREETGSSLPINVDLQPSSDDTVFRASLKNIIKNSNNISPCIYKSKIRYANERTLKRNNLVFSQLFLGADVNTLVDYSSIVSQWSNYLVPAGLTQEDVV